MDSKMSGGLFYGTFKQQEKQAVAEELPLPLFNHFSAG